MSFEERMERLAERHEALAQTVEMHNSMLLPLESQQEHQREMLEGLLAAQREQGILNRHQHEMLNGVLAATQKVITVTEQLTLVAARHDAHQ